MVVVKPERVGFGERRRWPERLLLSGLWRAPIHVFVGRRRPYDGVQWRELGVGRSGRVESSAAEEQRPGRVLFVVAHRTRGLLAKVLLEERLARTRAGRLFRGAGERGREYLASVVTQFPATAAVLLLLLLLLVVGLRRVVGLLQRRRVRRELFQRRVGERQAVHLIAGRRRLHRERTERRRLLGLGRGKTAAAASSTATATAADAHAWRERRRVHRHGRRRCGQRCERRRRRRCHRFAGGRRLKALLQRLKVGIRRRRQIVDGRPAVGRQVYRGRQVRGLLLLLLATGRRHRLQRRRRHGHREHVVLLLVMMMVLQATDPGHGVRLHRNVLPASSQQTC